MFEAVEYIGELHISNPNGLYLQIPDWPTHPGLYPEPTDSSRIPTKRIALTSNYDDDSIDFFVEDNVVYVDLNGLAIQDYRRFELHPYPIKFDFYWSCALEIRD